MEQVAAKKATSIDYANLIRRYTRDVYGVSLVKTQVLKILYIIYGLYLAETGSPLFSGDQLQAWPYGPVFPCVYRHYKDEPGMLSDDVLREINNDDNQVRIIKKVIRERYFWSAYELSEWSHQEGGPWYKTVYNNQDKANWGAPISDDMVKEYFSNYSL